jgi:ABC-type polysaccharide/polyol phosphate transport system ATPase subunit
MSNEKYAIEVNNVSKSFKLPHQKTNTVKGLFVNLFNFKGRRTFEKQEVLRGLTFKVKEGEFLGIVGRNGGGKSTLLKILAGIYQPNSGSITIDGKLTPFIELGVGFNPELTGRENLYLNGALLGFSKREMDEIYESIVSFAELEKFMDQKLKNYSSGMQVRLAFSIAIQAKTDILLIDEVLAVGDANFQKKCFDIFETFKEEGRTVIFISHSMQMVNRFCDRAILINKGKIVSQGEPEVVSMEYEMLNNETQKDNEDRLAIKNPREAHIVESVLSLYKNKEELIEVGSANGRHVELINSMGIKTFGLDALEKPKKSDQNIFYQKLSDIKNTDNIEGLLILDNRKSISPEYLATVFSELSKGRLKNVKRMYVHLPFHVFQEYSSKKTPKNYSHLAEPLSLAKIMNITDKYGFVLTKSETYGIDRENQYIEAVLDRFDKEKEESLWGSSSQ